MSSGTGIANHHGEPSTPRLLTIAIVIVCCAPFAMGVLGVDLGVEASGSQASQGAAGSGTESVDFRSLRGPFIHTLLAWSAFVTSMFALFLAFFHHRLLRDNTTLMIGIGLCIAGLVDALHIAAADQLIHARADSAALMPFTWVLGRGAKAVIVIGAVVVILWALRGQPVGAGEGRAGRTDATRPPDRDYRAAAAMLIVGLLSYVVIHWAVVSMEAPRTVFDGAWIARPYELIPLALYALLGVYLFPRLARAAPSYFTAVLMLSALPDALAQLHMALGARAPFDHHFNSAHALQIIAYWVPCLGLIMDYVRIHGERELALWAREQANQALRASEARVRAIVDTAVDAVITIDEHGTVDTFNPAAEKIFGYRADEIVGKNVKVLMPEPHRGRHDGYLARYKQSGTARIIGAGREVEGRRKSGKTFPMDLRVGEMTLGEHRRFVGMARDITGRKHMERMKDEFISTVSHELRTPLTSIRGSLGLLVGGALQVGSPEHQQLLSIALNNTERLVRLINDILDVEKIRSGKMHFNIRALELLPVIEQAVAANRGYADTYGVRIEVRDPRPGVWVMADRDRLMQVLTNLLSNAIKFSPCDQSVEVSMSSVEDGVRVAVRDHGSGIPEGFRDRIFERFTQAETSDSERKEGTGLGLHLCRSIIHKLGGTIGFDTETDVGTIFYFVLRERRVYARSMRAPTASEYRPCILICERDPQCARLLTHGLGNDGFDAHIARSAEQAHALLAANHYDALTVDLGLPDCDGVALVRSLRADPRRRNLPLITMSVQLGEGGEKLSGDALTIIDWVERPVVEKVVQNSGTDPAGRAPSTVVGFDIERMQAVLKGLYEHLPHRPVVLHVEHDAAVSRAVAEAIAERADVTSVRTLADGRRQLARGRYDLLIVELDLPDGGGEALFSLLDIDERLPVPVIIFSAGERDQECAQRVSAVLVAGGSSNAQILEKIRLALG